jgi:hypothetical protein
MAAAPDLRGERPGRLGVGVTTRILRPAPSSGATLPTRVTVVVLAGLAVGAATSFGQAHLNSPWLALVNSASPWLVPSFAVGALERRPLPAAVAGLVTCLLEVVGYYVTTSLRGFSGSVGFEVFWSACALLGGPVFGVAGCLWRSGSERLRGLGAAVIPAAFAAEGLIGYGLDLHYTSSAALLVVLGVAFAVILGLPGRRLPGLARWIVPVLAVGVAAELLLGLLYNQTFTRL